MTNIPLSSPPNNDDFKEFYEKSNSVERYLWDISIINNYNIILLNLFKDIEYKRIFLGEYHDDHKKKTVYGFFVVIDKSKNNSIDTKLKGLLRSLRKYRSLYVGNIDNENSVTLVLKLGLSDKQLSNFFESKYSKIFIGRDDKSYPAIKGVTIRKHYRLPITSESSPKDKELMYENTYLILTHSETYFNLSIAAFNQNEASLEQMKKSEYDGKLDLNEQFYNYNQIKNSRL